MNLLLIVLILAAIFAMLIHYKKFFVKRYSVNPQLNVSELVSLFHEHLGEKYEIYRPKEFGCDFVIKQSGDEGIACKLKKNRKRAELLCWPFAPDDKSRPTYFGSVIGASSKGKDILLEIANLVKKHSDLKID
jgi:hypothetical protein